MIELTHGTQRLLGSSEVFIRKRRPETKKLEDNRALEAATFNWWLPIRVCPDRPISPALPQAGHTRAADPAVSHRGAAGSGVACVSQRQPMSAALACGAAETHTDKAGKPGPGSARGRARALLSPGCSRETRLFSPAQAGARPHVKGCGAR